MKKAIHIQYIIGIIIAAVGGFLLGDSMENPDEVEYYNKTETLLDSIYNAEPQVFDSITHSNTYYEYEEARENVKF